MQLDLFSTKSEPPVCAELLAFPLWKKTALVRTVAAKLRSMSKTKGRAFWNSQIKILRKELDHFEANDIDRQIRLFAEAVRSQIVGCGVLNPTESPRGSDCVANIITLHRPTIERKSA